MIFLNNQIRFIKDKIENKLMNKYIDKILGKPVFDDEKLIILSNIIMNQVTLSKTEKENYMTASSLVLVALDTHEQVPEWNNPTNSKDEVRQNQLKVLAGDYYSGLYYLLLSENDDFDMIEVLAKAVKDINEYKMKLHYLEEGSIELLLDLLSKIDITLIDYVAKHVGDTSLIPLAKNWLLIHRLLQERKQIGSSSFYLKKHFRNRYKIEDMKTNIDELIMKNVKESEELIRELPNIHASYKDYLEEKLTKIIPRNIQLWKRVK